MSTPEQLRDDLIEAIEKSSLPAHTVQLTLYEFTIAAEMLWLKGWRIVKEPA